MKSNKEVASQFPIGLRISVFEWNGKLYYKENY